MTNNRVSWKIEAHPGRGPLEPPAKRSESTGGVLNEDLQTVDGGNRNYQSCDD